MSDLRVSKVKKPSHPLLRVLQRSKYQKLIYVVLVCIIAFALYLFLQNIKSNRTSQLNDVEYIVKKVNQHYILPTDEQPAMATISDKSKVTTDFLKQAENGDKVLIYQKAKKVIIYRPSIDRIVDTGPVSIAPSSTGQ